MLNQTWHPQLVPDGYRGEPANNPGGGLQGNLALILALAAFSAPRGQMASALNDSFKVHRWQPHNLGHGRDNGRGVIVTVYADPASPPARLKEFEEGMCGGPILA
ncbi:hypothetical protein MMC16_004898 [Acarospora aff. strigata]|nr:hypothetical protein [Acarospora aff. strigata]